MCSFLFVIAPLLDKSFGADEDRITLIESIVKDSELFRGSAEKSVSEKVSDPRIVLELKQYIQVIRGNELHLAMILKSVRRPANKEKGFTEKDRTEVLDAAAVIYRFSKKIVSTSVLSSDPTLVDYNARLAAKILKLDEPKGQRYDPER